MFSPFKNLNNSKQFIESNLREFYSKIKGKENSNKITTTTKTHEIHEEELKRPAHKTNQTNKKKKNERKHCTHEM